MEWMIVKGLFLLSLVVRFGDCIIKIFWFYASVLFLYNSVFFVFWKLYIVIYFNDKIKLIFIFDIFNII